MRIHDDVEDGDFFMEGRLVAELQGEEGAPERNIRLTGQHIGGCGMGPHRARGGGLAGVGGDRRLDRLRTACGQRVDQFDQGELAMRRPARRRLDGPPAARFDGSLQVLHVYFMNSSPGRMPRCSASDCARCGRAAARPNCSPVLVALLFQYSNSSSRFRPIASWMLLIRFRRSSWGIVRR